MIRIYLDHNASTPLDPRVAEAMRALLETSFGNPSSPHWAAQPAKQALEAARAQVAAFVGCAAGEIVFTSGGSESNNLALKGVFYAQGKRQAHIITSVIEHPSILAPSDFLERQGVRITRLPVDGTGRFDPDDLRRAITSATILITLMHANNEVGTIQPIEACARIAQGHGVPFHTDAAQSAGKIPAGVTELGVDFLSIAGHKLYAPKGIGALYIRRGVRIEPLIHGAEHENGRRAGTESALLAAGLGAACVLGMDLAWTQRVRELRDRLWVLLQDRFGDRVVLNGHPEYRLPNTLNVSFVGHGGADILAALDGIAASTGSACHAGRVDISPVLRAMGVTDSVGSAAVRFSLGRTTTQDEIDETVRRIVTTITRTRGHGITR